MIQSVLDSANDAIDKEHLASAVQDLAGRVDDWKSLKVEGFGELLRFGTFTVLKGDTSKDTEREVSFACVPVGQIDAPVLMLPLVVSHLPVRTNPPLLQGRQPQQAKIKTHG
jgi:cell division control protein 24